jgi:molecular chaperone DnaK (HSP70)
MILVSTPSLGSWGWDEDQYFLVVAIEFGTTLSRVGMYINNTFELFTDEQGRNATPSVVAYTDQGPVVGYEALEQATSNPRNTIYDIK